MSDQPQPLPYDLIPAEDNPLYTAFGHACVPLENYVYYFMDQMATREHYQGGMWEFRKYPNGALCMVFPDQTVIEPKTMNGNYVTCSLEAVSYAAWLIVLSAMSHEAHKKNDDKLATLVHDQYHGLLDAIAGRMGFVVTPGEENGCREPTEDELVEYLRSGKQRKHPELSAIGSIID